MLKNGRYVKQIGYGLLIGHGFSLVAPAVVAVSGGG
jgi:hypothetical protein